MDKENAILTIKKLKKLACGNLKSDADRLIEYINARENNDVKPISKVANKRDRFR